MSIAVTADPSAALVDALVSARPEALRRARHLLRGDRVAAEDLVADVIAHLWERGTATGEVYATPYLVRAVTNAVITRWRRQGRFATRLRLLAEERVDDPIDVVLDRIERDDLLAQVPDVRRRMLTMRYVDGLTQAEVARRLGLPKGTVASSTARALDQLRRAASTP